MNPRHQPISKSTRELIDRLLRIENIFGGNRKSYRSFGTVAPVLCQSKIRSSQKRSTSNLQKKGKLIIQGDEMLSFVGFKGNKQWIWFAIDVLTKEIVVVFIGKRDETGARVLWDSIPAIYRQCAVSYTDFCPFLRNSFS
jgi:hypothetical protein